jgi:hypothetical protein
MMKEKISLRTGMIALFILFAALSRFLPHPPNFTPIGGMALFGAAYFSRKYLAFLIPIAAMWLSDLALNNLVYAKAYPEFYGGFSWFGSVYVYAGFILIVLMGMSLLKKVTPVHLLGASLTASVIFFLITNFGSWLADPLYPKNATGLASAYIAGIPFFWNTLLGDLFYTAVLFGGFALVGKRFPQIQEI